MQPKNRPVPFGRMAVGLLSVGFVLYLLRKILIPFFLAAALAYLLGPLVDQLQKKLHWHRLVIVLLIYFVLLTPSAILLYLYGPLLLHSIPALLEDIPEATGRFLDKLFGGAEVHLMGRVFTSEGIQKMLLGKLHDLLGTAAGVLTLAGFSIRFCIGVILTLVLLFYLLLREHPLSRFLLYLTPPPRRSRMSALIEHIDHVIGRYVRGLVLIIAYASVSAWLGLGLVFHVPYAAAIALLTGMLELLPAVGPIMSWIVATLAALVSGGFWKALLVAAFYGALRISLDNFLGPIILGRAVRVHPVIIIFAFLAGGTLFGVLGLLLAVPLTATIKLIIDSRNSDLHEE